MTCEVHSMCEMPKELVDRYPNSSEIPFILQERHSATGLHYVIYTDNPLIKMNPRYAISRK